MPVLTTIIAGLAVAAAVGSTVASEVSKAKAAKAAKKSAKEQKLAVQIANARKADTETGAEIKLQAKQDKLKRGKGSLASRKRREALGGIGEGPLALSGPSAAAAGGL